ncbi:MAG: hypothetical protein IJ493_00955, partial [Clostridia bacterium]|nr:hypothetical protein [Clostridia bacterium]
MLDTASKTVKIDANDTQTNHPSSGILITKLDSITKEPLYGAVFEVTDSSGAVVGKANGRYVTDANGVIRIRGLKPDTYVVTEVEAPDGYIAAPEPQTIKVVPGEYFIREI